MVGSVVISNPAERKRWAFVTSIIFASLLPIIAVVGIVASVVLVSLNTARTNVVDEVVRASLTVVRSQAELIYDTNNASYITICTDPVVLKHITSKEGSRLGKSVCNAAKSAYMIYIPLKNPTASTAGWCVDNTISRPKKSKEPPQGATVCP